MKINKNKNIFKKKKNIIKCQSDILRHFLFTIMSPTLHDEFTFFHQRQQPLGAVATTAATMMAMMTATMATIMAATATMMMTVT